MSAPAAQDGVAEAERAVGHEDLHSSVLLIVLPLISACSLGKLCAAVISAVLWAEKRTLCTTGHDGTPSILASACGHPLPRYVSTFTSPVTFIYRTKIAKKAGKKFLTINLIIKVSEYFFCLLDFKCLI